VILSALRVLVVKNDQFPPEPVLATTSIPIKTRSILLSKVKNAIKRLLGTTDPIMIQIYRGYASGEHLFLKGRVLEDENLANNKNSRFFRNAIDSFKRFESDEIPNAQIELRIGDHRLACETDREGYFTIKRPWKVSPPATTEEWVPVSAELIEPTPKDDTPVTGEGELLFSPRSVSFGVITDVDDTILQTHVASRFKLKMLYTTFFKNAFQRMPMEGMVEVMQQLAKGEDDQHRNPVFYLSHSPWNIYDLIDQFLNIQEFPKGPILLRDYGLKPAGPFADHKTQSIVHILDTYPDLPFVLLGDSAEHDADFYIDIAKRFPGRIKAIYIRQTRDTKNARRIKELIEGTAHVEAVLIEESGEILQHARGVGLV
jgi:phosphatidate phosphatase APP1